MKSSFTLLLIAVFSVLFADCNKPDDSTDPITTNNSWKSNGTSFQVNNYTKTGDMWYAYDKLGNGITFSFASFPTSDGIYAVVGNSVSLSAGQVKVDVFGPGLASTYFATGGDHTSATVSVVGTQLKITLPDTWALKGGSSSDSVKISATLVPL